MSECIKRTWEYKTKTQNIGTYSPWRRSGRGSVGGIKQYAAARFFRDVVRANLQGFRESNRFPEFLRLSLLSRGFLLLTDRVLQRIKKNLWAS